MEDAMSENVLEEILQKADFSKETGLKQRLGRRLFFGDSARELGLEEMELVAAAGDLNESWELPKDRKLGPLHS